MLVVDDNEIAAKMLGMLLKALGNEVRSCYDGLTAIDVASEFHPDIILLDLGMPKLNGYETAHPNSRAAVGETRRIGRAEWLGPGRG